MRRRVGVDLPKHSQLQDAYDGWHGAVLLRCSVSEGLLVRPYVFFCGVSRSPYCISQSLIMSCCRNFLSTSTEIGGLRKDLLIL
jgi:hypothetical protein